MKRADFAMHSIVVMAGRRFFWADDDDSALERILAEEVAEYDLLVFSFLLIPNYWHLVLRPK
jgi:putative transposase